MSATPETDEAVKASNGQWSFVLKETCQRLERERDEWAALCGQYKAERDEAIRQRDETNTSSKYACDYNYEQKLKAERERDKAREDATNHYAKIGELEFERDELKKIVEQRILVGAEIHNKANSLIKQNDKTEAECERLRKQLTAATSALRQIHLEVGDWIRSTIIVEE